MKNVNINNTPLGNTAEALSYFLAGLYAFSIYPKAHNLVTLIVGCILNLYALIILINPLVKIVEKIPNIYRMFLLIILLAVCAGQTTLYTTQGILFFILPILFIVISFLVIVAKTIPDFNKKQLLTIFVLIIFLGLIQLFLVDKGRITWNSWDLFTIALLELINLAFLIKKTLCPHKNSSIANDEKTKAS